MTPKSFQEWLKRLIEIGGNIRKDIESMDEKTRDKLLMRQENIWYLFGYIESARTFLEKEEQ